MGGAGKKEEEDEGRGPATVTPPSSTMATPTEPYIARQPSKLSHSKQVKCIIS